MTERPWMSALEHHVEALKGVTLVLDTAPDLARASAKSPVQLDDGLTLTSADATFLSNIRKNARASLTSLRRAETFAWTRDAFKAAEIESRAVPDDAPLVLDVLPALAGWWWCDDEEWWRDTRGREEHAHGLLWGVQDDGFLRITPFITLDGRAHMSVTQLWWKIGAALGPTIAQLAHEPGATENELALMRLFLGSCVFLHQRILVTTAGHVERHRRKQLARESALEIPPAIRVVELRHVDYTPLVSHGSAPVDWRSRWIVKRHQRRCPSGKLVWVREHVKGPADKPLWTPQTVYEVKR